MTKKDYELIAKAIREGADQHRAAFLEEPSGQVLVLVERIADALASDNPRFNYNRFISAAWGETL